MKMLRKELFFTLEVREVTVGGAYRSPMLEYRICRPPMPPSLRLHTLEACFQFNRLCFLLCLLQLVGHQEVDSQLTAKSWISLVSFVLTKLRERSRSLELQWTQAGKLVYLPELSNETWRGLLPENIPVTTKCTPEDFRK